MQTVTTQQTTRREFGIRCRRSSWDLLRRSVDLVSDVALADFLNISESSAYKVMTGMADPSPKFIAHTLHAFPLASFDKLFETYAKAATR